MTLAGEEIEIDFAGTSSQHDGNLNCPLSVTRSACYFVVRVLTAPDIPASGGAYAPVHGPGAGGLPRQRRPSGRRRRREHRDVEPHHGCRLPRARPGRRRPGAGPGDDEQRHLRQPSFHVLRDDRRAGRAPAPTATARRRSTSRCRTPSTHPSRRSSSPIRSGCAATSFASARAATGASAGATASSARSRCSRRAACLLLTERRAHAPQGVGGGEPGERGRNLLNGEELPAKATRSLAPGDVLRVETPGGGGLGAPVG